MYFARRFSDAGFSSNGFSDIADLGCNFSTALTDAGLGSSCLRGRIESPPDAFAFPSVLFSLPAQD
jgi:hypothetical protein